MAFFTTSVPPLALLAVDFLHHIRTGQARDGNEPDLLLDDVAARLQERFQFRNTFIEALALPLDLRAHAVAPPSRRRRTIYMCVYVYVYVYTYMYTTCIHMCLCKFRQPPRHRADAIPERTSRR